MSSLWSSWYRPFLAGFLVLRATRGSALFSGAAVIRACRAAAVCAAQAARLLAVARSGQRRAPAVDRLLRSVGAEKFRRNFEHQSGLLPCASRGVRRSLTQALLLDPAPDCWGSFGCEMPVGVEVPLL